MIEEDIRNLAHEYAKEILSNQPIKAHAIPEIWNKAVVDTEKPLAELFEPLIAYICKDYCIVPKTTTDKHFIDMAKDYAMYLDPDNKVNREMIEVDSLGFLNWVMEKFCIVEKEKVNALQSEIFKEIMDSHDTDDWQGIAHYILDVMPRSFNKIFNI